MAEVELEQQELPIGDAAPAAESTPTPSAITAEQYQQLLDQQQRSGQEFAQFRQQFLHVQQMLERLQRDQAPASQPAALSKEEEEAGQLLYKLVERHPLFADMMRAAKLTPTFAQGYQGVQTIQQQAADRYMNDEHARLAAMAKDAGLPSSDRSLFRLSNAVAAEIKSDPDMHRRWLAGDRTVLEAAFKEVRADYESMRRAATADVAVTKGKMRTLPPRPTGGAPGAPALPKFGTSEADFHRNGSNYLKQLIEERGA